MAVKTSEKKVKEVKAWAVKDKKTGYIHNMTFQSCAEARSYFYRHTWLKVIRVSIKEIK